ncbi:cell division protein SepF [Liquorilactobacillus sicerae]|uniref:cell division protein SepF n=1 Tax=Liquorilactobacillus sicerae TaxID=1416943 RepID=UPI00247FF0E2|nr:cell division protein SepF [Liquorilactobacillus sicerae]
MAFGNKLSRFFGIEDDYEESEGENQDSVNYQGQNVVPFRENREKNGGLVEKKIALFEPRIYSDVKTIATKLLHGQAVVINFQRMDDAQAHRVVDFLTGTVFAIGGEIQRIGDQIFLCTPHGYVVEGDLEDKLDHDNF